MAHERLQFKGFSIDVLAGWSELTKDDENWPFTLCHEGGIGALLFSFAFFESGEIPNPSLDTLLNFVIEFGEAHGLDEPFDVATDTTESLSIAAASFEGDDHYVRVWYVSDCRSFAKVTYTANKRDSRRELPDSEEIIRSLAFG